MADQVSGGASPGAGTAAPSAAGGEPARGGRGLLAILLLISCAYGLFGRWEALHEVPRFFIGMYGMSAWNHLKYGYADFGLAQIVTPGPPVERAERQHYVTHPPLATWLSSLSLGLYGRQVLAARLPHLLCSIGAVVALGLLAGKLYGPTAGLWTVAIAAALPGAVKGGALTDPLGPAFVFWVSLAALFYYLHSQSGHFRSFVLLLVVSLLAVFTDWPAHIMCFALAAHALVYRTKARKGLMLLLPAAAVVVFVALVLYARSIPTEGHVFESLDQQLGKLSAGEGAEEAARYSLEQWGLDFAKKFVRLLSPFAVLAVLCALWRTPRAVFTRENRPNQHLLLLWAWPLPFVAAFHRFFYLNFYCFLVFVPAVAVTLGALASHLSGGRTAFGRTLRGVLAIGCGLFLILWSQYARTMEEGTEEVQRLRVAWAADLADHTAFEQESAFALHYARQMRFLADRRVRENVDSMDKVEALKGEGDARVEPLFVPTAFPCGEADFGRDLVSKYAFEVGDSTLCFRLSAPRQAGEVATQRLGELRLEEELEVKELSYALVSGADGQRVLYLGPVLAQLPRTRPGESVQWHVRFLDAEGRPFGSAAMAARPSASYFVVAPKEWPRETGRVEVVLRHHSSDAGEGGTAKRLTGFALRFLTCRLLGNPRPRVRDFLVDGKTPIVLSRF